MRTRDIILKLITTVGSLDKQKFAIMESLDGLFTLDVVEPGAFSVIRVLNDRPLSDIEAVDPERISPYREIRTYIFTNLRYDGIRVFKESRVI